MAVSRSSSKKGETEVVLLTILQRHEPKKRKILAHVSGEVSTKPAQYVLRMFRKERELGYTSMTSLRRQCSRALGQSVEHNVTWHTGYYNHRTAKTENKFSPLKPARR